MASESPHLNRVSLDSFLGCMLGAAVGDALGMAVEGDSSADIARRFPKGIGRFEHGFIEAGHYTDDTQMALVLLKSLVDAKGHDPAAFAAEFMRAGPFRGIGTTTHDAREKLQRGVHHTKVARPSKGNGSAMRVHPIGLAYHNDLASLEKYAAASSDITHLGPLPRAASVAMAYMVAYAMHHNNIEPRVALAQVTRRVEGIDNEFAGRLHALEGLLDSPAQQALSRIGTHCDVRESVPAAIYCFLKNPEQYLSGVNAAIYAGNDTDSVASMTGAMIGAHVGFAKLPQHLVDRLEPADPAYNANKGKEPLVRLTKALYEHVANGLMRAGQ